MGANPRPKPTMTVDEFVAWSEAQPRGRFELENGEIVTMQSERAAHRRSKGAAFLALRDGIRTAGLSCHAEVEGGTIRIDETTAYEPDALVYCGDLLPRNSLEVPHPVIVIEVLSPGSINRDMDTKLAGYFTVPSLHHYLIVNPEERRVIHYQRGSNGVLSTRIATAGELKLDPPGLMIEIEALFGEAEATPD